MGQVYQFMNCRGFLTNSTVWAIQGRSAEQDSVLQFARALLRRTAGAYGLRIIVMAGLPSRSRSRSDQRQHKTALERYLKKGMHTGTRLWIVACNPSRMNQ